MPFHSLQSLSPTAVLGLWHLTEAPADLWPHLPADAHYRGLLPATADAGRQAQWLAGRALVHRLLAALPQLPPTARVRNHATGRPWLAGAAPGAAVSVSHSGEWVAAVVAAAGRVGVDVERVRDKAQRIARKFLAPDELAHAARHGPETAAAHFTLLWSAKETLYKLAARPGLVFREQLLLAPFEPGLRGHIPATLRLPDADTRHRICYSQPAAGYVLTYCHEPAP